MPITYDDRLARLSLRLTEVEAEQADLRRKIRRLRADLEAVVAP